MDITKALIDYEQIISRAPSGDTESLRQYLAEELPHEWTAAYKLLSPHQANILVTEIHGFGYLFDFSTELVASGKIPSDQAVEDRIVAVHGMSRVQKRKRKDWLMRKQPLGPVEYLSPLRKALYDRGHFVGHAIGGTLDINIFPQFKAINRGESADGKRFRSMERYCLKNPVTYCFSRPLYGDITFFPQAIEFGVLKTDGTLWVNLFPNYANPKDMNEIQRIIQEKLLEGG